jgi:hypothetical protein
MGNLFLIFFLSIAFCLPCTAQTVYLKKTAGPLPPPPADAIYVSNTAEFFTRLNGQKLHGKTMVLNPGTYEIGALLTDRSGLQIVAQNLTLRGATGDPKDVIIKGSGFTSSKIDEEMLQLSNADGFTIADLTIGYSRCHALKYESAGNHDVLIHNVVFIDVAERSVKVPGGSSAPYGLHRNTEIRYCTFI